MIDPSLRVDDSESTSDRALRQFAGLTILFLGGLACLEGFGRERWTLALLLAGLAVTVGSLGLARPQAIRPLFVGLMIVTFPIGWLVSKLLLGFLFYGVFTPVGLIFKLIGRDPLARRRQAGKATYWAPRPMATGAESYFRQS